MLPADRRTHDRCLFTPAVCLSMLIVVGLVLPLRAESFRERVEADWKMQDQCRMFQVEQPGVFRLPTGDVAWEGVPTEGPSTGQGAIAVPKLASPTLDGRLDDPCWKQAVEVPLGPVDQPVQPKIRLSTDGSRLYVGATFPTSAEACFWPASTASDASGAVDGVKSGRYGFHTNMEPNPWWQVDLGSRQAIGKVVIYNRLDYSPGLHNADNLVILTSDDGKLWTPRYENKGKAFRGITDHNPLEVAFKDVGTGPLHARFLRIQLPSPAPIFFHLDEVEVYAPGDAAMQKNLALGRPADQSSRSPWSRGGDLVTLGKDRIGLAGKGRPDRRHAQRQSIAQRPREDRSIGRHDFRGTRPGGGERSIRFSSRRDSFPRQPVAAGRRSRLANRLAGRAETRIRQEPTFV